MSVIYPDTPKPDPQPAPTAEDRIAKLELRATDNSAGLAAIQAHNRISLEVLPKIEGLEKRVAALEAALRRVAAELPAEKRGRLAELFGHRG